MYGDVFAVATGQTHPSVIETLRAAGVEVETGPAGVPGLGQRRVLAAAVEAGYDDLFLCDLDRWLHWLATYPDELSGLPERLRLDHPDAWYICLGRTGRALATHPVAQQYPEAITNRALCAVTGRGLDATACASWIRLPAARLILDGSTATSKATDLEWPGLVLRTDPARVDGVFLDGLEFETADAWPDEIAAAGSVAAWIQATYDRPHVLRDRLRLAADSIEALMRVTADP